jgi:class 3 adenylate cyclase
LSRKLEIRDEKVYGYVVFWNRIDREIERIKSIHPRIGVVYMLDGSPRPFGESVGDLKEIPDRRMVVTTIGDEPFSVLSENLQPGLSRVFKFPLREKHEFVWKVTRTAMGVAVGALIMAIVGSFFISRGLSKPILTLVEATHEIDRGNFQVRVNIESRDELGLLGSSFNEMAQGLEEREKRKAIMRKTLSADVENELMSTQEVTLGGTLAEVTIMFVDIRGFTTMSEGMPPEQVVAMLNEYMSMADRVIQAHHGFVSKFIGDGILALFGAGRKRENPALDAVQAGAALLKELQKLNQVRKGRGEKEIRIGVGINTGEVLKGNVGSEQRLEFTVIGEQVNLASRLCSNAKPLQVLISESCFAKVSGMIETTRLDPIAVKGFSRPIQVYEVVSVRAGA